MIETILIAVGVVGAVGFVAYKFPAVFGKAVKSGADVVNAADDKIKATINPYVDQAKSAVSSTISAAEDKVAKAVSFGPK